MRPFDHLGRYRPEVETAAIRGLAVRGAGVTVLSGGLGLAVQVASTVVLARLLLPRDFGLVALVSTFSLLLMNFGLNGFTEAILQWDKINHSLVSNLFWINVSIGTILTIAFAGSGHLIERFFRDPMLPAVTAGMSLTILLSSLSVHHLALLKRAMRFTAVSGNEMLSRIVSVSLSILLAREGWGYRALVGGALAGGLTQTLGAWYLCRWIPGIPRRATGTRAMVSFAMSVYGRFSVNYFSRNVDNLLVGWRFGATPLGFYKKAYDLFALSASQLTAPLTNVAVAALSRYNPGSEQYKRHLMSGLAIIALVGMGLSGVLTLAGADLLALLLGPGWEPSAKIFTYFGPGVGAIVIYYVHGWIHLSIGRADRWLRWGIVESVVTFACFLAALPWGPEGVAVAWTASLWLLLVPAFWYALSPIKIEVKLIIAVLWRYIVAALLAALGYSLIAHALEGSHWLPNSKDLVLRIAVTLLLYTSLYVGAAICLHRKWLPLPDLSGLSPQPPTAVVSKDPASAAMIGPNAAQPGDANLTGSSREPLVSILIPAYNAEECIADALRSALAQTWEPKEIIVVDDGSTDGTLAIARRFEANSIVRVVTQENHGAAAARNTAFSLSRGQYIQWLDADDLLAPDKIALQMSAAKQVRNSRIVFTSAFGIFTHRYYRAQFTPTELWRDQSPVEWLINKMSRNIYMQTGTWLVSRELSQAAGPWDHHLLGDDDGEYFCRVLLKADHVRFIGDAKAYYRKPRHNSLSYVGDSARKREAQWRSMNLHIDYLRSIEDSDRTRAACVQYLQGWMTLFYAERLDIFMRAQEMARDLGGHVAVPAFARKYAWIERRLGWRQAKRAAALLRAIRWSAARRLDKVLYQLDRIVRRDLRNNHRPSQTGNQTDGLTGEMRGSDLIAQLKDTWP
jgi:glycosyltransferase involved in cell wall biosynthesis/O-antigen/teichoic acid export membrane protein